MILHVEEILAHGQTADIFQAEDVARVYKLFKRLGPGPSEQRMRDVFDAERQAYEIVRNEPDLQAHTPEFFGAVTIESVTDSSGTNQSSQYLLDCCLVLERLRDTPVSVFSLPQPHLTAALQLLERFAAAGIDYAVDAEVVEWQDTDRMKLIDFATHDARAARPE